MNHDRREAIRPMLAKSSPHFDSERHIFELEWDGTSCIAFIGKGKVALQKRRLLNKLSASAS
jgi:hypothetical protein